MINSRFGSGGAATNLDRLSGAQNLGETNDERDNHAATADRAGNTTGDVLGLRRRGLRAVLPGLAAQGDPLGPVDILAAEHRTVSRGGWGPHHISCEHR